MRSGELKILLLEDDQKDAELIEQELRSAGIALSLKRVDKETDFLKELDEFLPDAILADYILPQLSALEALRILKDRNVSLPFILVTGSQSEEVSTDCLRAGADDYILKASLKRLPPALLNALSKRETEQKRKKAEEALRRSEERYRLIAENTLDLICMLDIDGRCIYVSPSCREMLGYTSEEFTGTNFYSLVHPDDREAALKAVRQALFRQESVRVEYRYSHKRGNWIALESRGSWIFDEAKHPHRAVIISRDITERKLAEEQLRKTNEQLRALSAHLQAIREEERTLIAREIHDELGASLSGVKMDLAWIERRLPKGQKPIREKMRGIFGLMDDTIRTIRRIATELRPGILDDLGLMAAIEWQAQEFQRRTGIVCNVHSQLKEIALDRDYSTALFRIFQETLTNVARHANATRVEIRMKLEDNQFTMIVDDNGRGITEEEIANSKSLGILGIRERTQLLNGEFQIMGTLGKGTTVTVSFPLSENLSHALHFH